MTMASQTPKARMSGIAMMLPSRKRSGTWIQASSVSSPIVSAAIAEGAVAESVDPKWATLLILSAANWLYQWYDPRGPLSADDIADRFTTMILSGLAEPQMADAKWQITNKAYDVTPGR